MNTKTSNIEVKPELLESIKELCTLNRDITLIGLSTTDGFNIKSFAAKSLEIESDKLSAMSSSLCALSNSTALQLTNSEFEITTIESNGGNILFMNAEYLGHQCVVSLAAKADLSLAQARFCIKRFANEIKQIQ